MPTGNAQLAVVVPDVSRNAPTDVDIAANRGAISSIEDPETTPLKLGDAWQKGNFGPC